MPAENDKRLRRMIEEPPNMESRDYVLNEDSFLLAVDDIPFYPPYVVDNTHYHNCLEIGLCVSGTGILRIEGRERRFASGGFHVIPKGVRHSQVNQGTPLTQWRYVAVNEERLLRESTPSCRRALHWFLRDACAHGRYWEFCGETVEKLIQSMCELRREHAGAATPEVEACVLLLLTTLARREHDGSQDEVFLPTDRPLLQPIDPALLHISRHYDQEIRISELARLCAMSESYFRKQFLKLVGQTPLEYMNRYRIHRSTFLLRNSHESIVNIASRTGFSSAATFHRNFQKYTGEETPTEWRKNHAKR